MKLLTKKLLQEFKTNGKLPEEEQKFIAHVFNPTGMGDWWAMTYDEDEKLFFGYARITDGEYGYFSLTELEEFRGTFGLRIERDLHFTTTTKQQFQKEYHS